MQEYRSIVFEASRELSDDKLRFKGIALTKAIQSLETVPDKVHSGGDAQVRYNLREGSCRASADARLFLLLSQNLQGIGRGIGGEIDEWLETGRFAKMEDLKGQPSQQDPEHRLHLEQREA